MTDFQLVAVILTMTTALAYANARFVRLPTTVGLMATALVASGVLVLRALRVVGDA